MTIGNGKIRFTVYDRKAVVGNYGSLSLSLAVSDKLCSCIKREKKSISLSLYGENSTDDEMTAKDIFTIGTENGDILSVSTDAMFDLDILVSPCGKTKIEYFEKLSSDIGDLPCVKITNGSEHIYFILCGGVGYSKHENRLHISPSIGCICAAVDPVLSCSEVRGEISSAPTDPFMFSPSDSPKMQKRLYKLKRELSSSFSEYGGILIKEGNIETSQMLRFVRIFCVTGDRKSADKLLGFIFFLIQMYGNLPHSCFSDGSNAVFTVNAFEPSVISLCRAASEYNITFGLNKNYTAIAEKELIRLSSLVRGGMMPPNLYDRINNGSLHGDTRFFGSQKDTLSFLFCVEKFFPLTHGRNREKLASVIETVRRFYGRNFGSSEYSPLRLEYIKKPHLTSGYCDRCSDFAILEKYGNTWICDNCIKDKE